MFRRLIVLLLGVFMPLLLLVWGGQIANAGETAVSPEKLISATAYDVIINEWSQGDGGSKEWVELLIVNGPIDLRGWDLGDSSPGDLTFSQATLWEAVPAGTLLIIYNDNDPDVGLPPNDDDSVDCRLVIPDSDITYFSGSWAALANGNSADNPHLRDAAAGTIHDFSVDPGGDPLHPEGNQSVKYVGGTAVGVQEPGSWENAPAGDATPGLGNGGTNTAWIDNLCGGGNPNEADISVTKAGPSMSDPGTTIEYDLSVTNLGTLIANNVLLTDTLPAGFTYISDDSGLPLDQSVPGTLVWTVGNLNPGGSVSFKLTLAIGAEIAGEAVNGLEATTSSDESNGSNNTASATTFVGTISVLIDAVLYDGYESGEPDEAVALRNVGETAVDLTNWTLGDGGATTAAIPNGTQLAPGQSIWITKDGDSFERQFGFPADVVPSKWPGYANSGDEVILRNDQGELVDVLVYENGNTNEPGWNGSAVQPYQVTSVFGVEGQILYRKRDPLTGQPVPDSDQATDWAQAKDDVINGRKVRYPGWDLDEYFFTTRVEETAVLTVAIAPDNAYESIVQQINSAQSSIKIESLTFENVAIANALISAAQRGVTITILLEGGPPGGLPEQEKYICQQLEAAGAQCWFAITDSANHINDRYRFMHAKFFIIDGQRAIISSENLSPNSMPSDDKSDGTLGRRGVVLMTDAPGVVAYLQQLFSLDFDPANHVDIFRWQANHATYGAPASGFVPDLETGGTAYTVRYPSPSVFQGEFEFEMVQSPENSLRDVGGLLGLVAQAGAGDTVLVEQLQERPFWGSTDSNATDDPNPRLEAYISAARRGARVRLLLDSFFDDPDEAVSNASTCLYVNQIAETEALKISCALGNPAGLGIHNKMVLLQIGGKGYAHIGSLNGTEQSSKGNRELALQVQSDGAYALLADMFERDIVYTLFLPLVMHDYLGAAPYPLISEVLYNPPGQDQAEFIELVNPTAGVIDLSNYSLGDALLRDDFEDVRRFPPGTLLAPRATLVIATTAAAFQLEYGVFPDFEIIDTETAVPDLIDDPTWGDTATFLQLGNSGDEIILRDPQDNIVDAIAYGDGNVPGIVTCSLVTTFQSSLERFPYWRDMDDCTFDFREWPFPNPGTLSE